MHILATLFEDCVCWVRMIAISAIAQPVRDEIGTGGGRQNAELLESVVVVSPSLSAPHASANFVLTLACLRSQILFCVLINFYVRPH